MKNMHTLYDYVCNSRAKDIQAAKGLSKWPAGAKAVSATWESIKTEKHKAQEFLKCLFGHHKNLPLRVTYLLFGSLLIGYEEFVRVLQAEPTGRYADEKKHPVVLKIYQAMSLCGVSMELFKIWTDEIHGGYVSANYLSLPANLVPECQVDGRTVFKHMSESRVIMDELCVRQLKMQREITEMKSHVEELVENDKKKTALLMDLLTEIRDLRTLHTGEPLPKRAKLQDGINDESSSQPSVQGVVMPIPDWTIVSTKMKKAGDLANYVFKWHDNNVPESYQGYITENFLVKNLKVPNSVKTDMSQKIKKVKTLLDNHMPTEEKDGVIVPVVIKEKPTKYEEYSRWEEETREISRKCFENAISYMGEKVCVKNLNLKTLTFTDFIAKYKLRVKMA